LIKLTASLALLICLVLGCAPRESAVEAGIRSQTLHIGNNAEPPDLDPHTNNSLVVSFILSALNEGLVGLANDGSTIKPGLAERWEISPDGLRYTFHLRPNAKWSNGEAVTAHDYVAGIRRFLNPLVTCEAVNIAFPITGARDFAESRSSDFASVGVTAPDARTVEIRLDFRAPYFLSALADTHLVPLYQPMLDEFDGHQKRGGKWTLPGNLISNGPFTLEAWEPNVAMIVVKNPHYWQADQIALSAVHFHPIEDGGGEERAFRAGQLHVTFSVPTSKLKIYLADEPAALRSGPILRSDFIAFNTTKAPFDNPLVRRAFSLAIDRDRLVSSVLQGQGSSAYTFTPAFSGGYDLPPLARYDPATAQQLMAEAGYPGGEGFPPVEFTLSSRDQAKLTWGQALQQMWKETLGVELNLAPTEFKVWLDILRNQSHLLTTSNWNLSVDDPTDMLALGLSTNPNNDAYWKNPRFDAAFDAINQAATKKARRDAIIACERLIHEEAPWAPIFFTTRNQLVHPSVQGWQGNPLQIIDWTALSLRAPASD